MVRRKLAFQFRLDGLSANQSKYAWMIYHEGSRSSVHGEEADGLDEVKC
jgi:hypothetical protein